MSFSLNKIQIIGVNKLYHEQKMSVPQIAVVYSTSTSTMRLAMIRAGIKLRTAAEGMRLSRTYRRPPTRKPGFVVSQETKEKIRKARLGKGTGVSLKPSGYLEHTMGEHKFKSVHRVIMEQHVGRPLNRKEHVHHINGDKLDNRIENLMLINIKQHMSIHATDNYPKRRRLKNGTFA